MNHLSRGSITLALALGLAGTARAGDAPASPAPAVKPPCGLNPHDWCTSPSADDPCGVHRDEVSCRSDARCRGLRYNGESVVSCMPDAHGFWSNCPAVGCVSRSQAPGQQPRPETVNALCTSVFGGAGAEVHVWRTSKDEVTVLEVRPAPRQGEATYVTYFDVYGHPLVSLPLASPAGSARASLDARQREAVLSGLRAGETVACSP